MSLTVKFADVVVHNACNLAAVYVQMYLDDTCNEDGSGNTITLRGGGVPKEDGHFHLGGAEWNMVASRYRQNLADEGGWKMPDVAKIVVTADCSKTDMGEAQEPQHGLMGSVAVPLKDLLEGMASCDGGRCAVPILNSYTGECVTCVELQCLDAAATLREFTNVYPKIFKPSQLPSEEQVRTLVEMYPRYLTQKFYGNIVEGKIALKKESISKTLSLDAAREALCKTKGGMFLEGLSMFARVPNLPIPHVVFALPAIYNHREQPALMDKGVLLQHYHAGLAVFDAYGWTPLTIVDKISKMKALDTVRPTAKEVGLDQVDMQVGEEVLAFCVNTLTSGQALAGGTQQYKMDAWIMQAQQHEQWKTMGKLSGRTQQQQQRKGCVLKQQFGQQKQGGGYILTYQAEDFQVPNATRACFDASKSEMSPTGNNDCESSSHAVVSNYLSFVEMCGISDTPLRKVDMRKVCQQLELHIFNSDSKFVFDGGNEPRVQFLQRAGPVYYPEFEQWVMANRDKMSQMEQYKYGLAALAAFLSSRNFFVDQAMGGAYGASAEDPHKKELGGHSYLIMGIKESRAGGGGRVLHSSISEQTVYALPRMHSENKTQVKQIMQAEKGLSAAIGQLLFNDRESAKVKPMVQMANKEHTEDFYGDLFVVSHVQPYCKLVDIGQQQARGRSYGAYAFTVVNGVKMFGVQPEHAHSRGAQYIEVCGQDVDRQMMMQRQYCSSSSGCGGGGAAAAAGKPFTDSVRQCVLARREMSPGVVSKQDWCIWQQRMWGFDFRSQTNQTAEGRQAVPFSAPGRVARVTISCKDQKELQAVYTKARELASPAGVAKLKAFVAGLRDQFLAASTTTVASDENAQSICLLGAVLKSEAVDCIRVSRGLNVVIVSVMCTGEKEEEGSFCSGDAASSTAQVYENHFATCPLILAKMFAEPGLFKQQQAAAAAVPASALTDVYQKYCAGQTQRGGQQRLLASRRYCFGPISRETGVFKEDDIWMHADACQTCIFTTAADKVASILSEYGGAKHIIDASPGAGEMSYAFSKKFARVEAIISGEQKQQGEFLVHNLSKMHCANIQVLESKAAAAAAADDTVVFYRNLAVGEPAEGSFVVSLPTTGAGTLALALPISMTKPPATAVRDMKLHAHHCIYLNFAHIFNLYIYTRRK